MNLGFSISITFITHYLLAQEKLTTTSVADATISTHSGGNSVAISKPNPKHIADLIRCLKQFTVSPYISLYTFQLCVNKTG